MLNNVCLQGRLVEDPELKKTKSGISVCSTRIAVDRSYCKAGENRKADFINIIAWKNSAELLAKYFGKGQLLLISGSLQQRSWEDKEGNKHSNVEVLVQHIDFCGSKSAATGTPAKATQSSAPANTTQSSAPANTSNQPPENTDFEEIPSDDDLPF